MSDLNDREHALYRFYGHDDVLLYIGITAALPNRLTSHRDEKPWWTEVARITVEHFSDRVAVLAAERAAIIAERPRYNVQHNGQRGAAPAQTRKPKSGLPEWTFQTHRFGTVHNEQLWLAWEAHCDPISDDYFVDEISAEELWRVWLTRYPVDESAEAVFGPGAVSISWFVEGSGTFEGAPFQDCRAGEVGWQRAGYPAGDWIRHIKEHQFLHWFTWPYDQATGERLQWSRLPVADKVWRSDNLPAGPYTYKGGFIQEATGWKPSPFQPYVNVHQLATMAGLYAPERSARA